MYGTLRSSSVGQADYTIRTCVCVYFTCDLAYNREEVVLDVAILWRIVALWESSKVCHNANFPSNSSRIQSFG